MGEGVATVLLWCGVSNLEKKYKASAKNLQRSDTSSRRSSLGCCCCSSSPKLVLELLRCITIYFVSADLDQNPE